MAKSDAEDNLDFLDDMNLASRFRMLVKRNEAVSEVQSLSSKTSALSIDVTEFFNESDAKGDTELLSSLETKTNLYFDDEGCLLVPFNEMVPCAKCGNLDIRHPFTDKNRSFCSRQCMYLYLQKGPPKFPPMPILNFPVQNVENDQKISKTKHKRPSKKQSPSPNNLASFKWPKSSLGSHPRAPVSYFAHVAASSFWKEIVAEGMVLEVEHQSLTNKDFHPDTVWLARIICISGYFLLLRYLACEDDKKDFWVNIGSEDIHTVGWAACNGVAIMPPIEMCDKIDDPKFWQKCLVEQLQGAKTIPWTFHDRIRESQKTRFSIGMTVELVDKNRIAQMKPAKIEGVVGKRLMFSYFGTMKKSKDFACHEDSPLLHPVGWSFGIGAEIDASQDYIHRCLTQCWLPLDATEKYFEKDANIRNNCSDDLTIRSGMKIEAIDPLNLSTICVATIQKVLRYNYLMIRIDSYEVDYSHSDWFCYHATSTSIFNPGYCSSHNITLVPPISYINEKRPFVWSTYLKENNYIAAQLPEPEPFENRFEAGMHLEVADLMEPKKLCVATVKQICGRLLRVSFDGWSDEYDQWMDFESVDIYPVGWCDLQKHKLEGPPEPLLVQLSDTDEEVMVMQIGSTRGMESARLKKDRAHGVIQKYKQMQTLHEKFFASNKIVNITPRLTEKVDKPRGMVPRETVPREMVPREMVPRETVPRESVPRETVPRETVPRETVPRETVPRETVPRDTVPRDTVPRDTVPRDTVPRETVPRETVPRETVPRETVPRETVPREMVPRETVIEIPFKAKSSSDAGHESPISVVLPRADSGLLESELADDEEDEQMDMSTIQIVEAKSDSELEEMELEPCAALSLSSIWSDRPDETFQSSPRLDKSSIPNNKCNISPISSDEHELSSVWKDKPEVSPVLTEPLALSSIWSDVPEEFPGAIDNQLIVKFTKVNSKKSSPASSEEHELFSVWKEDPNGSQVSEDTLKLSSIWSNVPEESRVSSKVPVSDSSKLTATRDKLKRSSINNKLNSTPVSAKSMTSVKDIPKLTPMRDKLRLSSVNNKLKPSPVSNKSTATCVNDIPTMTRMKGKLRLSSINNKLKSPPVNDISKLSAMKKELRLTSVSNKPKPNSIDSKPTLNSTREKLRMTSIRENLSSTLIRNKLRLNPMTNKPKLSSVNDKPVKIDKCKTWNNNKPPQITDDSLPPVLVAEQKISPKRRATRHRPTEAINKVAQRKRKPMFRVTRRSARTAARGQSQPRFLHKKPSLLESLPLAKLTSGDPSDIPWILNPSNMFTHHSVNEREIPRLVGVTPNSYKPGDIAPEDWSAKDVAKFLRINNCEQYSESFSQRKIDGLTLLNLTYNTIILLTSMKVGPALLIADLIAKLKALVKEMDTPPVLHREDI